MHSTVSSTERKSSLGLNEFLTFQSTVKPTQWHHFEPISFLHDVRAYVWV